MYRNPKIRLYFDDLDFRIFLVVAYSRFHLKIFPHLVIG